MRCRGRSVEGLLWMISCSFTEHLLPPLIHLVALWEFVLILLPFFILENQEQEVFTLGWSQHWGWQSGRMEGIWILIFFSYWIDQDYTCPTSGLVHLFIKYSWYALRIVLSVRDIVLKKLWIIPMQWS